MNTVQINFLVYEIDNKKMPPHNLRVGDQNQDFTQARQVLYCWVTPLALRRLWTVVRTIL